MFGKIFKCAFTGSLRGLGPNVFSVLAYVIANTDKDHMVELNAADVADRIGMEAEAVQDVIDLFCRPDEKSKSKESDGRRLVKQGEYQYFVVNHEHYRGIKNMDDLREYNRDAKRRERAKKPDNGKPKRLGRGWKKFAGMPPTSGTAYERSQAPEAPTSTELEHREKDNRDADGNEERGPL